jgi:hypothetical protein
MNYYFDKPAFICKPLFNRSVNLYIPAELSYNMGRVKMQIPNWNDQFKSEKEKRIILLELWLDTVKKTNQWKKLNNVRYLKPIHCQNCNNFPTYVCETEDENENEPLKLLCCGVCQAYMLEFLGLWDKLFDQSLQKLQTNTELNIKLSIMWRLGYCEMRPKLGGIPKWIKMIYGIDKQILEISQWQTEQK